MGRPRAGTRIHHRNCSKLAALAHGAWPAVLPNLGLLRLAAHGTATEVDQHHLQRPLRLWPVPLGADLKRLEKRRPGQARKAGHHPFAAA
jgi:hypothetical protein